MFVQGPLRRIVEIPIVVDRVTGETTIQQRLGVETIPPLEALDKHNLATFVRAREGYSWMFLQRDFDQVARMAVPAVFADYNRQFEGEAALQKKIGAAEDWRIQIVGVRLSRHWPQRQPRRGHGHLRQGGPPDRPQPARRRRRGMWPASSTSTSPRCSPRNATGWRTRSASSSRPTGRTPRSTRCRRGRSHDGPDHAAWPLAFISHRQSSATDARAADPRLREVTYDPRAVVTVPVKRGVVTHVVLDARRSDHRRRRRAWAATAPSPSPPGASLRRLAAAHLFVKPKLAANGPNNLAVVTDRRTHAFRFVVLADGDKRVPVYRLVVKAPAAPAAAMVRPSTLALPPLPVLPALPPPPRPDAVVAERLQASADGREHARTRSPKAQARQDIVPTLVFDDGRFTYLRFPGNREVPAVFHVLGDGSETPRQHAHGRRPARGRPRQPAPDAARRRGRGRRLERGLRLRRQRRPRTAPRCPACNACVTPSDHRRHQEPTMTTTPTVRRPAGERHRIRLPGEAGIPNVAAPRGAPMSKKGLLAVALLIVSLIAASAMSIQRFVASGKKADASGRRPHRRQAHRRVDGATPARHEPAAGPGAHPGPGPDARRDRRADRCAPHRRERSPIGGPPDHPPGGCPRRAGVHPPGGGDGARAAP